MLTYSNQNLAPLSSPLFQNQQKDLQKKCPQIYQNILKRRSIKQKFDDNIHLQRMPSINCPGCTQFYFMNMNIYNPQISNCKIALMGPVNQLMKNSYRFKQQMCATLNGGGGVLLFNCSRSYLLLNCWRSYFSIIPRGDLLTQKNKLQIDKWLKYNLDCIHPKPQVNRNVVLTFVPLKQDPFDHQHDGEKQKSYQDSSYYHKRNYIKGLYVPRIRVSPSNGRTTYVLVEDNSRPVIPIRLKSIFDSQNAVKQIKGREMTKFIKKRFEEYKYEVEEGLSQVCRFMVAKTFSDFDHQCKKPDTGQLIFKKQQILASSSAGTKKSNYEKDYRFASILVCRKERHQQVKFRLKKYNINCEIQMPYEGKYTLRGTNNSAILYHNVRFSELLQIISYKKQFEFDGKFAQVILITDYIRLPDRNSTRMLTPTQMKSIQSFLKLQHPKQRIYMWRYKNEKSEQEIYLQTQSKAPSFFLYLILDNNYQKPIFQNPKDIDKYKLRKGAGGLKNFQQIHPDKDRSLSSTNFQIPNR